MARALAPMRRPQEQDANSWYDSAMIVPAKERRICWSFSSQMRAFAQPAEELYSNAEWRRRIHRTIPGTYIAL